MPLSVKWYICHSRDSNPLSHDPEALSRTKLVDQTSSSGSYEENDQTEYNEHIPCVVVVVVCLFGFNVAFNNFSVISRRCLVATGSSVLTFIVLRH